MNLDFLENSKNMFWAGNSQHQERKQHHQPQQLPTAAAAQPPAAVMAAQQQQVQPEEMIQDNTGSNSGYNTSETMDQNLSAYDTRYWL